MGVPDFSPMAGHPEGVLLPLMRHTTGSPDKTFGDAWFDKGIVYPMLFPKVASPVGLSWALRRKRRAT